MIDDNTMTLLRKYDSHGLSSMLFGEFCGLIEGLRRAALDLADIMERDGKSEFPGHCPPVSRDEWFGAIKQAKKLALKEAGGKTD